MILTKSQKTRKSSSRVLVPTYKTSKPQYSAKTLSYMSTHKTSAQPPKDSLKSPSEVNWAQENICLKTGGKELTIKTCH